MVSRGCKLLFLRVYLLCKLVKKFPGQLFLEFVIYSSCGRISILIVDFVSLCLVVIVSYAHEQVFYQSETGVS